MSKEITITINDDGSMEVQGLGLGPGEQIQDVAKFVTDSLGDVLETGHRHTHSITESNREIAS